MGNTAEGFPKRPSILPHPEERMENFSDKNRTQRKTTEPRGKQFHCSHQLKAAKWRLAKLFRKFFFVLFPIAGVSSGNLTTTFVFLPRQHFQLELIRRRKPPSMYLPSFLRVHFPRLTSQLKTAFVLPLQLPSEIGK